MTYNMSGVESANNIADIFIGVNNATQNSYVSLAGLILLAVFSILFIVLMRAQPAAESLLGSSAICMLVSLMLLALGAIGSMWVVGFGVLFGISAVGVYLKK